MTVDMFPMKNQKKSKTKEKLKGIEKNIKKNVINESKKNKIGKKKQQVKSKPNNEIICDSNLDVTDVNIANNLSTELTGIKKMVRKTKKSHNVSKSSSNNTILSDTKPMTEKVVNIKSKNNISTIQSSETSEQVKRKRKVKHDIRSEHSENMNIGENVQTATKINGNSSVGKDKKRKMSDKTKQATFSDNIVKEGEKCSTSKKRRNRRKKHDLHVVLVQNLPFSIIPNYKTILKAHFSKFGKVHSVGIADLKCTSEKQIPIFTTRIFFMESEGAEAALKEDHSLFEGNIIRVKRFNTIILKPYKPGMGEKSFHFRSKMKKNKRKNNKKESECTSQMSDNLEKIHSDSD